MFALWLNWALAFGAIVLVLALAFFIPKNWLPLPVVILSYILFTYSNSRNTGSAANCVLTLRVASLTLFWTAIVMELINILNTRMLFAGAIDWSATNKDIPYITCLILFPVMAIICAWEAIRGYNTGFCRRCQARNGIGPGTGVVASVYSREVRYQLSLLLCVSVILSGIEYWYYAVYYFNVNMNTPDRFFFNIMPMGLYAVSLYFMWLRYTNLGVIIGPMTSNRREHSSQVRFLILSGDYMKLTERADGRLDTPARAEVGAHEFLNEEDARKLFARLSGRDNFELRFLYTGKAYDMTTDMIHYAVILPDDVETRDTGNLDGQWYTLEQISRLLNSARLNAEFSDEIYRIYTTVMAWKTYDQTGRRLYPIKHYRPTFRLRDFGKWDVDYADVSWLRVARTNQDTPFFRTRRFWNKLTGGRS